MLCLLCGLDHPRSSLFDAINEHLDYKKFRCIDCNYGSYGQSEFLRHCEQNDHLVTSDSFGCHFYLEHLAKIIQDDLVYADQHGFQAMKACMPVGRDKSLDGPQGICMLCDMKPIDRRYVHDHIHGHLGYHPHRCKDCDFTADKTSTLDAHRHKKNHVVLYAGNIHPYLERLTMIISQDMFFMSSLDRTVDPRLFFNGELNRPLPISSARDKAKKQPRQRSTPATAATPKAKSPKPVPFPATTTTPPSRTSPPRAATPKPASRPSSSTAVTPNPKPAPARSADSRSRSNPSTAATPKPAKPTPSTEATPRPTPSKTAPPKPKTAPESSSLASTRPSPTAAVTPKPAPSKAAAFRPTPAAPKPASRPSPSTTATPNPKPAQASSALRVRTGSRIVPHTLSSALAQQGDRIRCMLCGSSKPNVSSDYLSRRAHVLKDHSRVQEGSEEFKEMLEHYLRRCFPNQYSNSDDDCNKCGIRCKTADRRRNHAINSHHIEKLMRCPVNGCTADRISPQDLKEHIDERHKRDEMTREEQQVFEKYSIEYYEEVKRELVDCFPIPVTTQKKTFPSHQVADPEPVRYPLELGGQASHTSRLARGIGYVLGVMNGDAGRKEQESKKVEVVDLAEEEQIYYKSSPPDSEDDEPKPKKINVWPR